MFVSMTLQQWRQDKSRVKQAAQLIATPFFKEMMETVIESIYLSHSTPKVGHTDGDRSYLLGVVDGGVFTVSAIKSLGTMLPQTGQLEPDYGAEKNS